MNYHSFWYLQSEMSLQLYRVFVYGTLKRGFPNHFIIQSKSVGKARFMGEAKLSDRYPLVVAGSYNIPFLLPVKGQGDVSLKYFS